MTILTPTATVLAECVEAYHPLNDVQITAPYKLLEQAKRPARQFTIIRVRRLTRTRS